MLIWNLQIKQCINVARAHPQRGVSRSCLGDQGASCLHPKKTPCSWSQWTIHYQGHMYKHYRKPHDTIFIYLKPTQENLTCDIKKNQTLAFSHWCWKDIFLPILTPSPLSQWWRSRLYWCVGTPASSQQWLWHSGSLWFERAAPVSTRMRKKSPLWVKTNITSQPWRASPSPHAWWWGQCGRDILWWSSDAVGPV